MATTPQTDDPSNEPPYGPQALLERDYESLTPKQASAIDMIVKYGSTISQTMIAEEAGCTSSYLAYVRSHFPHIIDQRKTSQRESRGLKEALEADGGETQYEITLPASKVWQSIKLLPEELSQTIFHQIRNQ